ncbi:MAG TPA: tRNA (adenosine(37)-N6)-dimethylallyltransferase MiaA [Terriglobales bacterium]|nr:tRNA (adenosine(37)-N6)-dimethylallyltransferase MiaA [Terriglobales bacterium]
MPPVAAVPPHPTVLALAGPTGSGKTELGIALAQRLGAEIVNADSRQIFRGLDIGSAKPTLEQRAVVPHHLFDVVAPDQPFDVARYRALALAAVADITRRGRRVLLVGGTGLYLKVLRGGLFEGPPRNPALRQELSAVEDAEAGALHRRLQQVDSAAAARLHPNDRLRLIRALEVFAATGRRLSQWQAEHRFGSRDLELRTIALAVPRDELYRRIDRRCAAMLAAGMIDEVAGLLAAGYDPQLPAMRSTGYGEITDYLLGRCTLAEASERMARATRQLAKRQLTWFRNDPTTRWCQPELEALVEASS